MSAEADADLTEAFEIMDDGTRIAILQALAEHETGGLDTPGLSFSELRERVGTTDSGRFNYHLKRLRDTFVVQDEAGYKLSPLGQRVVSAVVSGAYTPGDPRGPEPIDGECLVCGDALRVQYESGLVTVTCENGHGFGSITPPGSIENRPLEAAVALMSLTAQHEIELALEGTCPMCYGPMTPSIDPTEEHVDPEKVGVSYFFLATCDQCGMNLSHFPAGLVVRHPAVVSLFYDHGIDLRGKPVWELPFVAQDPEVVSDDPLRLRIEVPVEDDGLALTLDERGSVLSVDPLD